MVGFSRRSSWLFALFGAATSAPSVQLPENDLHQQPGNANGPDGQRGAHGRDRLQIMQLVIRNQRKNGKPDSRDDKKPDDLTAMTGGAALRRLA